MYATLLSIFSSGREMLRRSCQSDSIAFDASISSYFLLKNEIFAVPLGLGLPDTERKVNFDNDGGCSSRLLDREILGVPESSFLAVASVFLRYCPSDDSGVFDRESLSLSSDESGCATPAGGMVSGSRVGMLF